MCIFTMPLFKYEDCSLLLNMVWDEVRLELSWKLHNEQVPASGRKEGRKEGRKGDNVQFSV